MIRLELSPRSQRDLQKVSRAMRETGDPRRIRRELTAGLKKAAAPVVERTRAAASSLPAGSGKSTGFRRRMARAISLQVRTSGKNAGVKVGMSRSRMAEQSGIARYTNDPGHWRRPTFGGEPWITQTTPGRFEWFDREGRRAAPEVRKELGKVLDDFEKKLKVT